MALKRIGALWNKKDKNKREYLSGSVDLGMLGEARIMIFPNEKTEENHPDWAINLATADKEKEAEK